MLGHEPALAQLQPLAIVLREARAIERIPFRVAGELVHELRDEEQPRRAFEREAAKSTAHSERLLRGHLPLERHDYVGGFDELRDDAGAFVWRGETAVE